MDKCQICKKILERNNHVWYSRDSDCVLCKSHWFKWIRSNECKNLELKHKKAKPTTKAWHKRCEELQIAFEKWLSASLRILRRRRNNGINNRKL